MSGLLALLDTLTALHHLLLVIGFLVGLVLTPVAWRTKAEGFEGWKDPRLKVLSYGSIGLVAALIADWDSVFKGVQLPRYEILLTYTAGFALAVFVALSLAIIWIFIAGLQIHWAQSNPYTSQWFRGPLDYLHNGYGYWQERVDLAIAERAENPCAEIHDALTSYRQLSSKAANNLAGRLALLQRNLDDPRTSPPEVTCDRILDDLRIIADPWLQPAEPMSINANLMIAVPYREPLPPGVRLAFTWEAEPKRYSHLLVIKRYADPNNTSVPLGFSLPVENIHRRGWEDRVLPGAPHAFVHNGPAVVDQAELRFAQAVPNHVQHEMESYIRGKKFNFFVSLVIPIRRKDWPMGVVNIEANRDPKAAPFTQSALEELNLVLQPYCALLGVLMSRIPHWVDPEVIYGR